MDFSEYFAVVEVNDDLPIEVKKAYGLEFLDEVGESVFLDLNGAIEFVKALSEEYEKDTEEWRVISSKLGKKIVYEENLFRAIYAYFEPIVARKSLIQLGARNPSLVTKVLSKLICFIGEFAYLGINVNTMFDSVSVSKVVGRIPLNLAELLTDIAVREKNSSVPDYENLFRIWMRDKAKLSEKSIENYSKSARNFVNKHLRRLDVGFKGVFAIDKLEELKGVVLKLSAIPEYVQADEIGKGMHSSALKNYEKFLTFLDSGLTLPKPFLLLAGISGTGKTRYIRQQALRQRSDLSNYLLIPVRPDWHEPSDLLGYVSRIGGEKYVPTLFLKFIAAAWRDAFLSISQGRIILKPLEQITTYWACLDEMNLAPVEQYFADYLSILETRAWSGNEYKCDAILHPGGTLKNEAALNELQTALGLHEVDDLWKFFLENGLPIPPNLIVAGTVNMDETTHGFSRKVIDRAISVSSFQMISMRTFS
jgi:hypothetical protein